MQKPTTAQIHRQASRKGNGQYEELAKCECCSKTVGDNYWSVDNACSIAVIEILGFNGLILCKSCYKKAEHKINTRQTQKLRVCKPKQFQYSEASNINYPLTKVKKYGNWYNFNSARTCFVWRFFLNYTITLSMPSRLLLGYNVAWLN